MNKYLAWNFLTLALAACFFAASAEATFRNRLSVVANGTYEMKKERLSFSGSAELETRLGRYVGIGAFGTHILSKPATTMIGAPSFFFHLAGGKDWFVSLSPIIILEGGRQHFGGHMGTRAKIGLGVTHLYPTMGVGLAGGETYYTLGIGVDLVNAYAGIAPIR